MNYTRPVVLTVAGSDSGGGAGIQADLKTMTVHGCFGVSVVTALTAQNTVGVQGIYPIPLDFIHQQLTSIFDDFDVVSAKTGMLHSSEIIHLVAEFFKSRPEISLVCDPVMVAKSGDKLLRDDAIYTLKRELLPLSTVITPNIPEAEVLWEHVIQSEEEKEAACKAIYRMGARSVLLKGGHEEGEVSTDLLYDGVEFHRFSTPRYTTKNTHGTGCTRCTFRSGRVTIPYCDAHLCLCMARCREPVGRCAYFRLPPFRRQPLPFCQYVDGRFEKTVRLFQNPRVSCRATIEACCGFEKG